MLDQAATAAEFQLVNRVSHTDRARVLALIQEARSEFSGAAERMGFARLEALAESIVRVSK